MSVLICGEERDDGPTGQSDLGPVHARMLLLLDLLLLVDALLQRKEERTELVSRHSDGPASIDALVCLPNSLLRESERPCRRIRRLLHRRFAALALL